MDEVRALFDTPASKRAFSLVSGPLSHMLDQHVFLRYRSLRVGSDPILTLRSLHFSLFPDDFRYPLASERVRFRSLSWG